MDIRRRFLSKKSSGGSSGGDSSGTYTVNLNSQWEKTTAVTNPDSSLYDGVYRSTSNYNVHSTAAIMYIDISGLTSFKLYIRSYAESGCDYVMVSQLDQTVNNSTFYSNTSLVKAHTRTNQQSGTALSSYTLVEFTGIDGGSHRITVVYRKDGSANSGDDRGYVLIPKSQESGGDSGGGDVDIDTTYSIMYTSSNGNVVTPYQTNVFGANITSNTYVNGQGIITFDGPVTSIGGEAFYLCTSLTSITIPDSVTLIGDYAFADCKSLTSVTIPDSVTKIGRHAFRNCTNLNSITIPNSVTSIGDGAFMQCKNLRYIESTYATADNRCLIIDGTLLVFAPYNLTSYTIPDNVTSIGNYAVSQCSSLTSVTIPDSVISLGEGAFYFCYNLASITIPDSVTSIKSSAFSICNSLKEVYCMPTTPPTGGSSMFSSNASNRIIYVPTASVDAYKSSQYWSDYADYIVGYDFEDDGGGSSELITFTIAGTEYQAEEGMTWGEWIDSEYNVISAFISASNTVHCGNSNILTSTYNSILSNELILHGESYIIGSHTGGGGN